VPERWLGDPEYAHDVRGVLQPFSVGPRNCIGRKYVSAPLPFALTFGVQYEALCAGVPVLFNVTDSEGTSLAYVEMRLILARLLWNFDLELMPESKNWSAQKIFTLWEKGGINVKLFPVLRELPSK
jgi:cytochrome P450